MATKNNNTLLYASLGVATLLLLKKRSNNVSGIGARSYVDENAAEDLYLWLENDSETYFKGFDVMAQKIAKKIKQGQFDSEKALKALENVADYAARTYNWHFYRKWDFGNFNKATRQAAALKAYPYFIKIAQEKAKEL